ncbi:MAG: hypothetical protein R2824_19755 [Saprospiraceae bacterium]|nr:hypothetical protein [Lewinella sp.]
MENLRLLDPEEKKPFERWLNSPWCNTNKKCVELFRILLRYYPDFTTDGVDVQKLYRKLYPDKAYRHKSMLNLLSNLSLEVENFLVHQELKQADRLRSDLLRTVYRKKGKIGKEAKSLREEIDQLAAKDQQTEAEHLHLAQLYERLNRQEVTRLLGQLKISQLQQGQYHLDQYYVQRKLRILAEQHAWTQVVKGEQLDLHNELVSLKVLIPVISSPAGQWYYRYLSRYSSEANLDFFLECQNRFEEVFPLLEQKDRTIILMLLINETARLKLASVPGVLELSLSLYQFGLRENILLYQGEMTPRTFANIVSTANGLQQYEYTKTFIMTYSGTLEESIQRDARLWAVALTAYLEGTTELIKLAAELSERQGSVNTTTFSLRISVLLTQLRFDAYWQDEEVLDDAFWKQNDAFAKRLGRRKDYSPKHIQALKRFNDYTRKLAELLPFTTGNRERFKALSASLEQEKSIHAKGWLLQRMKMIAGE